MFYVLTKTSMLTLMLVTLSLVAQNTKYTIEATLNPELKLVKVEQEIRFTNPASEPSNLVYLQDWVNAYKDTQTPLAKRYAEDFNRSFYSSAKSKRRIYNNRYSS